MNSNLNVRIYTVKTRINGKTITGCNHIVRRDVSQAAFHALERQRVAHIGRVEQAPISYLRGLASLPLWLRWREREPVSDRTKSSKRSEDGTYSHVRREVGHTIERIVVVGLEGRTPFRRGIGRPALDG